MDALQTLSIKATSLGCIKGESAAQFLARNRSGAEQLAKFITKNHAAITKAISGKLCAS